MNHAQMEKLVTRLCTLPSKEIQLRLNWLSSRSLAVILKYAGIRETSIIRDNMNPELWKKVQEEASSPALKIATRDFVEMTFTNLQKALTRENYDGEMKDLGYRAPGRNRK